jgi:hypothetical protein
MDFIRTPASTSPLACLVAVLLVATTLVLAAGLAGVTGPPRPRAYGPATGTKRPRWHNRRRAVLSWLAATGTGSGAPTDLVGASPE